VDNVSPWITAAVEAGRPRRITGGAAAAGMINAARHRNSMIHAAPRSMITAALLSTITGAAAGVAATQEAILGATPEGVTPGVAAAVMMTEVEVDTAGPIAEAAGTYTNPLFGFA
jgi:hypothetical protein